MKSIKHFTAGISSFCAILILCLMQTAVWATGPDVNIKVEKKGDWYAQPWVWIVGGAVFLLLLVALMRGGSRKD